MQEVTAWGLGELAAFFVETQSLQSAVCGSLAIYKTVCCRRHCNAILVPCDMQLAMTGC